MHDVPQAGRGEEPNTVYITTTTTTTYTMIYIYIYISCLVILNFCAKLCHRCGFYICYSPEACWRLDVTNYDINQTSLYEMVRHKTTTFYHSFLSPMLVCTQGNETDLHVRRRRRNCESKVSQCSNATSSITYTTAHTHGRSFRPSRGAKVRRFECGFKYTIQFFAKPNVFSQNI